VCETLLKGVAYTSTPPALACNHGADPYYGDLDGSKSTSSDGALSYAWSFVSKPPGSSAALANANCCQPDIFVPDKAGAYAVNNWWTAHNGASKPSCGGLGGCAR